MIKTLVFIIWGDYKWEDLRVSLSVPLYCGINTCSLVNVLHLFLHIYTNKWIYTHIQATHHTYRYQISVCVCVLDDFTSTCINLEILSFQPENRDDFVFINSHKHFWKDRTLPVVSCATWWNLLKTRQQFLIATCQIAMSTAASVTGFHRVVL